MARESEPAIHESAPDPKLALLSLGLTDNEACVYLTLLRLGHQTPAALAPQAG